ARREGCREDDAVRFGEQVAQSIGSDDAVEARLEWEAVAVVLGRRGTRVGATAHRDDAGAERGGETRHGPAERAVADDADRQLAQLLPLQRLARPLPLQLEEVGQVPAAR